VQFPKVSRPGERVGIAKLTSIRYGSIANPNLRRLNYQYDVFGNLSRQSLNADASSESYTYDTLHRLTEATRLGAATGTVTYAYDAVGNFNFKSDFSRTAKPGWYNYDPPFYNCGGGPNAVKQVQLVEDGSTRQYCYDANGNLISDNAGLAMQYDHTQRPIRIARGAVVQYLDYGPDGSRFRRYGSEGETQYFPGVEQFVNSQGIQKTYVGSSVLVNTMGGVRRVDYLLTDRLGSVDAIANSNGVLTETRGYDAFGKPRTGTWANATPPRIGSTATSNTPHGFTGHEHLDSLELIHMNGRVYDYSLGRFTGVDPVIQFPLNSQSLNPYSYILNNPLSGTDPTGYAVCSDPDKKNCTEVKEERVAPTGSHIKSSTRVSGTVSNGTTTGKIDITVNKDGKVVSGGISISNGAKKAESRKEQSADAATKGTASSRTSLAGVAAIAGEALPEIAAVGRTLAGMVSVAGATVGAAVIGTTWSNPAGEGSEMTEGKRLNYGLDAAWSTSLVEATRLRNSSDSVVIGETQSRVDSAADALGAETINFGRYWIEGRQPNAREAMASIVYNAGWMTGVMSNQMHIYDIGLDSRPRGRSPNYRIERQMIDLARYPNYEQRPWAFTGGWDYQNAK
jgi:RHS repeat-associated protein